MKDDAVLPADFDAFVRASGASARHTRVEGRGCWTIRFRRSTTSKEKLVLKVDGFRWLARDPLLRGGGCWGRRDPVSCGYCGKSFKAEALDAWKCVYCGRRCA